MSGAGGRNRDANDLDLLPASLASRSISRTEIVLPRAEALLAIDALEAKGVRVFGIETLIRDEKGRVGHPPLVLGTGDLDELTLAGAASVSRRAIEEDATEWESGRSAAKGEILFCITVARP